MSFRRSILSALVVLATVAIVPAFAQESNAGGQKELGAGLAFGLAGLGAGIGLGYVGAAGLAALSENPAMQSRVFIFLGMIESIAIYGIVIVLIILG
ncbi:MAG: ATP synthase subunit C [Candidatus Nitrosocaldaceae archaeon]